MLAILVPARNEEENIGCVLDVLKEINSSPENIFVIDNNSNDKTAEIAIKMKVKVIYVKEVGYEKAISRALKNIKELKFTKFMIVDGDNEIDRKSIEEMFNSVSSFNFLCGKRNNVKRIGEKIVNLYYKRTYEIDDLMCGLKAGDLELHNQEAKLSFGLDMFKFEEMFEKKIKNIDVLVNQRNSTRLGNFIKVNTLLISGLLKYHFVHKNTKHL